MDEIMKAGMFAALILCLSYAALWAAWLVMVIVLFPLCIAMKVWRAWRNRG